MSSNFLCPTNSTLPLWFFNTPPASGLACTLQRVSVIVGDKNQLRTFFFLVLFSPPFPTTSSFSTSSQGFCSGPTGGREEEKETVRRLGAGFPNCGGRRLGGRGGDLFPAPLLNLFVPLFSAVFGASASQLASWLLWRCQSLTAHTQRRMQTRSAAAPRAHSRTRSYVHEPGCWQA